jgi:hypothetical protein
MTTEAWEGRPLDALVVGGGGQEDRYSNALVALLQDPVVLANFVERCCNLEATDARAAAQVGIEGGRADIRIVGPGLLLVIEVKAGASLHGSQMTTYARHVGAPHTGGLFLLAPANQLDSLLAAAEVELGPDLVAVLKGGISWAAIRDLFRELGQRTDLSPRLTVYLDDFASVIDRRIETVPAPFTAEEQHLLVRQDIPLIADRLAWVADQILEGLSSTGYTVQRRGSGRGSYGSWVSVDGYGLWCGYFVDAWKDRGTSPFWIQSQQPIPGWDSHARDNGWPLDNSRAGHNTLVPLTIHQAHDMGALVSDLTSQAEMYLVGMAARLKAQQLPALPVEAQREPAEEAVEGSDSSPLPIPPEPAE